MKLVLLFASSVLSFAVASASEMSVKPEVFFDLHRQVEIKSEPIELNNGHKYVEFKESHTYLGPASVVSSSGMIDLPLRGVPVYPRFSVYQNAYRCFGSLEQALVKLRNRDRLSLSRNTATLANREYPFTGADSPLVLTAKLSLPQDSLDSLLRAGEMHLSVKVRGDESTSDGATISVPLMIGDCRAELLVDNLVKLQRHRAQSLIDQYNREVELNERTLQKAMK